jgi:phosphopantothenoylcysteine decarboxylase/phosphopantothenate--cysteine ligase
MLKGKKILVGVTGGIAAYKTATIIRLLVKEGAEVKVLMTDHAKEFITPLTLATLSKNPVLTEFHDPENGDWNSHVDLGIWADLFIIAPATANSIAKMASGIADNLLLTTYLSARCPVLLAPSMDKDMLSHPSTRINIETLRAFGNLIL